MRPKIRSLVVLTGFLVFAAAAKPAAGQSPTPTAYWKLDEGQGSTITDVLARNPGVVVGARWIAGVVGTALEFDGVDDYVAIPCETQTTDLQRLTTFTLEAWINLKSETWYPGVFAKPAGSSIACGYHFGWGILIKDRAVWVWSNEDGYWPWMRSVERIQENTWHHIAATSRYVAYAQREFHIYIDGVEANIETSGPGLTLLAAPNIYIGGGSLHGLNMQQLFGGSIDEVAIFPRDLTREEIQRHYENSRNGFAYDEIPDQTPPALAPFADRTVLWPPNHQLVPVTIEANASDDSGAPVRLAARVSSSEPETGLGSGDASPDWSGLEIDESTGTIRLDLRAERSGGGEGRTYYVTIEATDRAGNMSAATVEIRVPHDQRND